MPAPLFIKYRTKTGKHYIYDCGTGRIIEVDAVIYALIDDFRVLSQDELFAKYEDLGRENIAVAFRELSNLQKDGFLADHEPAELNRVELVQYDGTIHEIGEFWKKTAMLLILGITERCNLDCSYCCFSGKFAGQRKHSHKTMSLEIAQKAIRYYLENDQAGDGSCPITFYGGEPLLEFHLFQECVRFAGNVAGQLGKTPRFAISTNGTLLNDEVCDYLVEHDFLIMVSLDGPQAAHDRYRTFPNGKGSFDIIERNLRRFAERYPDYKNRGLNVTLAPPFDLEKTARFIEELYPDYPLTRAGIVNTGTEYRFSKEAAPLRYGCSSTHACKKNRDVEIERFRAFSREEYEKLKVMWESCMASIAEVGVVESYQKIPFEMLLFEAQIVPYHRRPIMTEAPSMYFYVPCLPGFTRRFVDVDGNYRVCERVDDSEAYKLGNVWDGPDVSRLERTMEQRRHFGDCANCQALKTCDICYGRIPDVDVAGFDPMFDLQCQKTRQATVRLLQTYTEIMEVNASAFDRPVPPDFKLFKKLRFGARAESVEETVIQTSELITV